MWHSEGFPNSILVFLCRLKFHQFLTQFSQRGLVQETYWRPQFVVTSPHIPLPLRIHPNSYLLDVKTITLHLYTSFGCQVCKYVKTKIFHETEVRMT